MVIFCGPTAGYEIFADQKVTWLCENFGFNCNPLASLAALKKSTPTYSLWFVIRSGYKDLAFKFKRFPKIL